MLRACEWAVFKVSIERFAECGVHCGIQGGIVFVKSGCNSGSVAVCSK